MPIYEYGCQGCGYKFEKIQKFSDDLLIQCPECEKDTLEKIVVQLNNFCLMGSGWHNPGLHASRKN